MRRITLLLVGMLALFSTTAQRKNFTYKFYGFVRGDLFYNSRANMAPIDGNFYLYPLDKSFDSSPDKPGGLSIQLCKSEKKEFYIRYSS